MHVPDGYLSISTCAAMYAASVPFWTVAARRLRRLLLSRLVPMLALFAAFSFVISMFNLPLPGGTTGHAAGVAIATVVLGPWGSILAISVALVIQALLFGDGGITAIGANCFNIAIVGSLVAHVSYRTIASGAPVTSRRRVFAAAVAGYLAINASAFVTAVELGIQPLLFRDPTGAPLYAPYPLSVAIPAMMIGHLTIAGLAELVVTAGIVSWLQRHEPSILELHTRHSELPRPEKRLTLRPLWVALAVLMLLTPLGLVAAGVAWGEWSADDFADPAGRAAIAAASNDVAPPAVAPQGLQRLASVWTAPIPDYAPPFMRSEAFGYMLSAMFGVGVILTLSLLVTWLAERSRPARSTASIR